MGGKMQNFRILKMASYFKFGSIQQLKCLPFIFCIDGKLVNIL